MICRGPEQPNMVPYLISNYMVQNNGALPRCLPGINITTFYRDNQAALTWTLCTGKSCNAIGMADRGTRCHCIVAPGHPQL